MTNLNVQKALEFAYFYLKFRPRTEYEIRTYLQKKRCKEQDIEEVILILKDQNLINDREFIKLFFRDRLRFKPKSVSFISRELIRLGVAKDLIQTYFEKHLPDELVIAIKALKKKENQFNRLEKKEQFKKSISFLLRKGFSYDTAKQAYQNVFSS